MVKHDEHPALVLGLGETGLGVVRALGRAGIPAFGVDHRRRIGFRSRHVTAQRCPHPVAEHDRFIAFLTAFARALDTAPPVLYVTSDAFLQGVTEEWDRLAPHVVILGPPPTVARQLLDKNRLYGCCLQHGVDVPRSVPAGPGGAGAGLESLAFPVFVKPAAADSRTFFAGAKGAVANDTDSARRIVTEATRQGGRVIVQEIVKGPDDECYKYCACIAKDGRPLLEFTLQKVRNYPAHFGVGSCCVSRAAPEVCDLGRRVFAAIGYRGVGSIEFKRDGRDGRWKLIEINARYWQQVALPTACGMNFPVVHYLEATGQAPQSESAFTPGVTWMSLDKDARSYLAYRREGTLTRRDWLTSLQGPRVISDFEWRDPWPVFGSPKRWRIAARWAALAAGVWAR